MPRYVSYVSITALGWSMCVGQSFQGRGRELRTTAMRLISAALTKDGDDIDIGDAPTPIV